MTLSALLHALLDLQWHRKYNKIAHHCFMGVWRLEGGMEATGRDGG